MTQFGNLQKTMYIGVKITLRRGKPSIKIMNRIFTTELTAARELLHQFLSYRLTLKAEPHSHDRAFRQINITNQRSSKKLRKKFKTYSRNNYKFTVLQFLWWSSNCVPVLRWFSSKLSFIFTKVDKFPSLSITCRLRIIERQIYTSLKVVQSMIFHTRIHSKPLTGYKEPA